MCRQWTPTPRPGGRTPDRGTCADPVIRARPENAGVAGVGTLADDAVVVARDAVCPRWRPLPVRCRVVVK